MQTTLYFSQSVFREYFHQLRNIGDIFQIIRDFHYFDEFTIHMKQLTGPTIQYDILGFQILFVFHEGNHIKHHNASQIM